MEGLTGLHFSLSHSESMSEMYLDWDIERSPFKQYISVSSTKHRLAFHKSSLRNLEENNSLPLKPALPMILLSTYRLRSVSLLTLPCYHAEHKALIIFGALHPKRISGNIVHFAWDCKNA